MLVPPYLFNQYISWIIVMQGIGLIIALLVVSYYYAKPSLFLNGEIVAQPKLKFWQVIGLLSTIVLTGYIGSRVFGSLEMVLAKTQGQYRLTQLLAHKGGLRWYGALSTNLLLLLMVWYTRPNKKILQFFDVLALAVCIGLAIGKLGCQFSGHGCYGIATTGWWGMYYPYGVAPNILPVHPTPLYDASIHVVLFGILAYIYAHKRFYGQIFCLFLITTSIAAFIVEIVRHNAVIYANMSFAQLLYLGIALVSLLLYFNLKSRKVSL